ncbi:hypothetical protein F4803DRAFT_568666 [Xylaria telfairii]|nr:hypothetical protein F4803DRAFT_568666 [Xylaria telfairii]
MVTRQEPQASHCESNSIPTDKNVSKLAAENIKPRPSVDVNLAQKYKEKQDLPPIAQGDSRPKGGSGNAPSPNVEHIQTLLHESLKIENQSSQDQEPEDVPPRDHVTGRMLSEFGRSCLRCTEKDLRCTFHFVGKESERQCVACRRSLVPYCVRFQPPKEGKRLIPFNGPPWRNPNFVAGTAGNGKTADLSRRELGNLLREFYHGESTYVLGNYVTENDVCNYVLPPFNGVDLPLSDRPDGYETMDWKDVLPDWRNRSLRPQQGEGDEEDECEKEKKRLAVARQRSLLPANPHGEEAEEIHRRNIMMMQALGGKGGNRDNEISLLRILRRYQPREQNLGDVLGETW